MRFNTDATSNYQMKIFKDGGNTVDEINGINKANQKFGTLNNALKYI